MHHLRDRRCFVGMASCGVRTAHRWEVTWEVQGVVYGQLWKVHGIGYETKRNWSVPQAIGLLLQGYGWRPSSTVDKMNELCHLPGFRHHGKLIEETGKSSYDTPSNVRSFYENFWLMLIRASPNKSAFISYLLTDFNASYICILCCPSPLCSHTDFWLKRPGHGGTDLRFFFPLKVHQWNDVCSKSFIASCSV